MPKYLLIGEHFLKTRSQTSAGLHHFGEEVEFDGTPGVLMLPLDQAAYDAQIAARTKYGRLQPLTNQQRIDELRARAGLNNSQLKRLAEAEAKINKGNHA